MKKRRASASFFSPCVINAELADPVERSIHADLLDFAAIEAERLVPLLR
jgi:hypothetical protein